MGRGRGSLLMGIPMTLLGLLQHFVPGMVGSDRLSLSLHSFYVCGCVPAGLLNFLKLGHSASWQWQLWREENMWWYCCVVFSFLSPRPCCILLSFSLCIRLLVFQ